MLWIITQLAIKPQNDCKCIQIDLLLLLMFLTLRSDHKKINCSKQTTCRPWSITSTNVIVYTGKPCHDWSSPCWWFVMIDLLSITDMIFIQNIKICSAQQQLSLITLSKYTFKLRVLPQQCEQSDCSWCTTEMDRFFPLHDNSKPETNL